MVGVGKKGGRRPSPTSTAGGTCGPEPDRVGVGEFVSVSRSFWKESQGAPSSLPSHVGTECKNTVCRDSVAGGQGHWVHLPQRHHCFHGLVLYSQSWHQRIRPRSCFSPEEGEISVLGPRLPAAAGLKQFPFLSACLWTFASQAPAEAPVPPEALSRPPGPQGWALCWFPRHQLLKETAALHLLAQ